MTDSEPSPEAARTRFHRTLVQVLVVQVVALVLLGMLQFMYTS